MLLFVCAQQRCMQHRSAVNAVQSAKQRRGHHAAATAACAAAAGSGTGQQHRLLVVGQAEAGLPEGGAGKEGLQVCEVQLAAPLLQLPTGGRVGGRGRGRRARERGCGEGGKQTRPHYAAPSIIPRSTCCTARNSVHSVAQRGTAQRSAAHRVGTT